RADRAIIARMDATTNGLLIASIATLAGNIVMKVFEERKRAQDREQDRKDREQAAKLTADHRLMMAGKLDLNTAKLDENTAVSVVAAAKADDAYREANQVNQKIAELGVRIAENTEPKR